MKKSTLYIPSKVFILLIFSCLIWNIAVNAQKNELLFGHWELQKVVFKKTAHITGANKKENFTNLFKTALLKTLKKNHQHNLKDIEIISTQAKELANRYYQSNIEFKPSGAFYNISEKPLSGEYLMDGKKLLMEWKTTDKNNFKILKITANELVLNDNQLKITHYYNHLTKMEVDAKWAKLKKEKEIECTKPDSDRVAAQMKEEEKINRKQ
ncbi:MAG: hypothetical protein ACOH1N_08175 [Lutibacter sp.]